MVHKTDRATVANNKVFDNGQVSKDPPNSRQDAAGIAVNNAKAVTLTNNMVRVERDDDLA